MVARPVPQTPVQHAQRHGQHRRVAHAPLAGEYPRGTGGVHADALHPHAVAGGVLPHPGIPARIPHRGRPFARKPRAEHHPARLDGAHDERHADLQREHSPDHGGAHARGARARLVGLVAHQQGAGDALARRLAPAGPDGGRRRIRHRRTGRLAAQGARGHRAGDARRGNHNRKIRHPAGKFRREDRRDRRRPHHGHRQRHGGSEPLDPGDGLHRGPATRREPDLGLQEPLAVARNDRPDHPFGRTDRLQRRSAGRRGPALRIRTLEQRQTRGPRGVHRLLTNA